MEYGHTSEHDRYTGTAYLEQNPQWHVPDSEWKADQILAALGATSASSVCEVGCGAGEILRQVHARLPSRHSVGYEIAPAAFEMASGRAAEGLEFRLEDASASTERFDLMLVIDVIEHVENPIDFLRRLRFKSHTTVLHIPLDLSVQSVIRPGRLLDARNDLGHLHYFTPETAVATVTDAGYRVQSTRFTATTVDRPVESWKARVARTPRRLLPRGLAARTLGGFSLMVVAENGPPAG